MLALRRTAGRVVSSSPSTILATRVRTFTSLRVPIPSLSTCSRLSLLPLQRRFASEGIVAQSEPESDQAIEASHEDISNAAAAEESQDARLADSEGGRAAASPGGVVKEATASIAGTAAAVGQTLSDAARLSGRSRSPLEAPSKTVFVGNLTYETRGEDLGRLFQEAGPITEARVVMGNSGMSRGFGYVTFETEDAAAQAIQSFHRHIFEGRSITVEYSAFKPRNQGPRDFLNDRTSQPIHEPTQTLFVGNLSFSLTDRDLNDLFREVENVTDVRVAIDRRTGQPRGFAHAEFVDVGSAERAMATLRGKVVSGRALRVDYSSQQRNDSRRSPTQ